MKKSIAPLSLFLIYYLALSPAHCHGQSPEISLREFASGQIKKGVRTIGMGGDGATWGNYSMLYRDTGTALIDGGATFYPNQNTFSFTAVGATSPNLWRGLTLYGIAISQFATSISTNLKSPGLGTKAIPVHGDGSNQALFIKAAMPLGHGFSIGMLLSYERSQFDAVSDTAASRYVRYQSLWLPSGGIGVTWQINSRFLVGVRALFNNDRERRIDTKGTSTGLYQSQEVRAGVSIGLWKGAIIDAGGNVRNKYSQLSGTKALTVEPNVGFEQNIWKRHFALRAGLDESSYTGGISIRFSPIVLDMAYVYDLGYARIGSLFGTRSNSVLATLVLDYGALRHKK